MLRTVFGRSVGATQAQSRESGFSLVELMVVITIIGVLAGIAVPRFRTFQARSQQAEAKSGLNGLFLSMQAFQANFNQYPVQAQATNPGTTYAAAGFQVGGNNPRYNYSVISNLGGWSAFAISTGPVLAGNFDTLRINTNKLVCNAFDAVLGAGATANNAQTLPAGNNCTQTAAGTGATRPALIEPADCALGQTVPCIGTP